MHSSFFNRIAQNFVSFHSNSPERHRNEQDSSMVTEKEKLLKDIRWLVQIEQHIPFDEQFIP